MEGLAETIRRVKTGVYGVANGSTEDVVQEALARAIKSGVSLEAEQWLRTVAKRVAIDQHRRRRETPSGAPVDLENHMPSTMGNPEDDLIRAERSQAVREALDALPPRYRKALLVYSEEDSPAAVANRLGLSAAATWTLLSRARSRLRLQLEQVGFVPAMMSMARARWRGIAAVGAAGAVAATAAIVPHAHKVPTESSKPKVFHVAPAVPVARKTPALKSLLPDAADKVTGVVNDTVNEVKAQVPKQIAGVTTCVGGKVKLLTLDIELIDTTPQRDLVSTLVEKLPAPLREIGEKTCVR